MTFSDERDEIIVDTFFKYIIVLEWINHSFCANFKAATFIYQSWHKNDRSASELPIAGLNSKGYLIVNVFLFIL